MSRSSRVGSALVFGFAALVVMSAAELNAQGANNPYHANEGWDSLPAGRVFGALSRGIPRSRRQAPVDVEQVWREHMC